MMLLPAVEPHLSISADLQQCFRTLPRTSNLPSLLDACFRLRKKVIQLGPRLRGIFALTRPRDDAIHFPHLIQQLWIYAGIVVNI